MDPPSCSAVPNQVLDLQQEAEFVIEEPELCGGGAGAQLAPFVL